MIETEKQSARANAKKRRAGLEVEGAPIELIRHFPAARFRGGLIGSYWPMGQEIDVLPLMEALDAAGYELALPATPPKGQALSFRKYQMSDVLVKGLFGTSEPEPIQESVMPDLLLVPLLAFTSDGKRLGYGGGYYDRTLAKLRAEGDVFACGVAYAGQEVPDLPTDAHDEPLNGILTEQYFRAFA